MLHEGIHSIYQPQVLGPLAEGVLSSAYGCHVEDLRRASPMPIRLFDYIGELVAYALDASGALGERCGTSGPGTAAGSIVEHWRDMAERGHRLRTDPECTEYRHDAWTGPGAAEMVSVVGRYLDEGRSLDEALVREALRIFEDMCREWVAPRDARATVADT